MALTSLSARSALVAGLFFLSGFSALIYQIAWQRLLGLFGGADTIAATLVVSAFLAGLGIGSLFGGLVADRFERRRALLLFALCEIAIACYAALSVWIFYDLLFVGLIELSRSRALVFTLAFVSLMAPTILMGLSLPLLSRALVDNVDGAARRIGGLYAINTLGAGAGALVAGFWLIGSFGYQTAILTGAVLNAVVGLGGLLAARAKGRSALDRPVVVSTQVAHADTKMVHRWCALVFVAGFLTVAVQVEWYRLFGTMMQGNAYGFALILGVFLIGDAIGLYIGARRASAIQDPRRVFLLLQGVTVLIAAGGVYLVYLLTGWAPARGLLVHADDFVISPHRSAAVAGTVVVMVFAASVVMGFTFPLSQRAVQSDATLIGHRVGIIQLANIAGNSLGGLVAGLVLLRFLGTAGAFLVVLALGMAVAIYLAITERRLCLGVASLIAAGVALALLFPDNTALWSRLHGIRAGEHAEIAEDHTGLAVLRRFANGAHRMYIQGHSQSCLPVCTVHAFLGMLGPLVHPKPENILVVGVAAGGTPYAAGINPETRSIRAVEIVAPVFEVLNRFVGAGGRLGVDRLTADPRYELVIGDGRHDLFVEGLRYDVIEADAILPRTAHSGLLYSREYFARIRAALKPGGLAVQWAPTGRTIDTFRSVFPHVVYAAPALIGSDRPILYDQARLMARLDEPETRAYLEAAQVNIGELRDRFFARPPEVLRPLPLEEAHEINLDLWPRDEYYLNNTFKPTW